MIWRSFWGICKMRRNMLKTFAMHSLKVEHQDFYTIQAVLCEYNIKFSALILGEELGILALNVKERSQNYAVLKRLGFVNFDKKEVKDD